MLRGCSSRTTGASLRIGEHRVQIGALAPSDRDDPGPRRLRHQPRQRLRVNLPHPIPDPPEQIRRQVGRQPLQFPRVRSHGRLNLGPESQRVLISMEPFQHRQLRITPRAAKPASKLFIGHGRIVPGAAPRRVRAT